MINPSPALQTGNCRLLAISSSFGRRKRVRSTLDSRKSASTSEPGHGESGIRDAARRLREGEITAVDLTLSYLKRIKMTDDRVHSFLCVDEEIALEQASKVDRELERGIDRGLLAGIPIAIKDNICTQDFRTTAGSKILDRYTPPYDASVVKMLKNSGAVLLGKTNMDEFGMGSTTESSQYAVTRNPWDLSRVPGGSSGGSAAAVAAQQCVAAIGSDTGGSVRQPASHCGVVGFKPTYGTVARNGLIAYSSSFDCIGTLTASVEDCAILMSSCSSRPENDLTHISSTILEPSRALLSDCKPLEGYRFGVIKEAIEAKISDEVLCSFWDSVELLRQLGASVEVVSCKNFMDGLPAYYILALSEASSNLARFDGIRQGVRDTQYYGGASISDVRASCLGDEVRRRVLMGTYTLSAGYADAYYKRANRVRNMVSAELYLHLRFYDALLTPVAATVAPKLNISLSNPLDMYASDAMTVNVNLSGLPALVLKGRHTMQDGQIIPIGFQVIGRAFGETELLKIGLIFEDASYVHLAMQKFAQI